MPNQCVIIAVPMHRKLGPERPSNDMGRLDAPLRKPCGDAADSSPRVCGRWTHALAPISFLRGLWRDRFRACVYAVTGVPGASVTASSCFGIGMPRADCDWL